MTNRWTNFLRNIKQTNQSSENWTQDFCDNSQMNETLCTDIMILDAQLFKSIILQVCVSNNSKQSMDTITATNIIYFKILKLQNIENKKCEKSD